MNYRLEQTPEGVDLVLTGAWSGDVASQLDGEAVDGLVLNYALGFRAKNLEFLSAEVRVRRLRVTARTIHDLSPIYRLAPTLQVLRINCDPGIELDLARLPNLLDLVAHWQQVERSIQESTRLRDLFLLNYYERDLRPLKALSSLKHLTMKDRSGIRSLDGMEYFPLLARLSTPGATELIDVAALGQSDFPLLAELDLEACRQISDMWPVELCSGLTFLNLGDCGDLRSIDFISGLSELEALYLYESTNVVDGNLEPILRLKRLSDFRMRSRRHYKPSVNEIQRIIAKH